MPDIAINKVSQSAKIEDQPLTFSGNSQHYLKSEVTIGWGGTDFGGQTHSSNGVYPSARIHNPSDRMGNSRLLRPILLGALLLSG